MERQTQRPLVFYLGLGLFQGVLLWLAGELWPEQPLARAVASFVLFAVLVGSWQVQMLYGQLGERRRWLGVLFCALLVGVLCAALSWQFDGERWYRYQDDGGQWLLLGNVLVVFLLTPFLQVAGAGRGETYPALARHAWNNGLTLLLALVLLGVFWSLIGLWVSLFKMLGVTFFRDIFLTSGFGWGASALVCSIAIRISLERAQILDALRNVLQAMSRFMLPITVLILSLFAVTLPLIGLQPLWDTRHAGSILLSLLFAHLCLVNGVFQDGSQASGYPKALRGLVSASVLVLPLLGGLAAYGLWLRIDQYGLTPERVVAALLVLLANLHALALCGAALRRGELWLIALRGSNPPLALLTVGLLVLVQIGPLNPQQLSAENQYQRLLQGEESADPGYLKYRLGKAGQQRLERLRSELHSMPEAHRNALQEQLTALDESESWWGWKREQRRVHAPLEWLNTPPADADVLQALVQRSHYTTCQSAGCLLWSLDLGEDGHEELLVLPLGELGRRVHVFGRGPDGEWAMWGWYRTEHLHEVIQALRDGEQAQRVMPSLPALRVGDVQLEPGPSW